MPLEWYTNLSTQTPGAKVLAGASTTPPTAARHSLHLSSLPLALAHAPATLIVVDIRPRLFTEDPLCARPTTRRIATPLTNNCRALSPTRPPPSPSPRDHARYRYGVNRKRRSGRSGIANLGQRTHHTSTDACKHTQRHHRWRRKRPGASRRQRDEQYDTTALSPGTQRCPHEIAYTYPVRVAYVDTSTYCRHVQPGLDQSTTRRLCACLDQRSDRRRIS
jgi:hypothetical protein